MRIFCLQVDHTIENRIRSIQNRKQAIASASMSTGGGAADQTDAQKSEPSFLLLIVDDASCIS